MSGYVVTWREAPHERPVQHGREEYANLGDALFLAHGLLASPAVMVVQVYAAEPAELDPEGNRVPQLAGISLARDGAGVWRLWVPWNVAAGHLA